MNKKLIEKEVLLELKSRNQTARLVAENNLQAALKNADFNKNYYDYKKMVFDIARKEYAGENTNSLRENLKQLVENLKLSVNKLNFKLADFKPNYYCKKCDDTGFVEKQHCVCYKELLSNKLIGYCGKENLSDLATFDMVNLNIYGSEVANEMKILFEKLKDYSENLEKKQKKIITLYGKTGVGKTFVAECVVENAIKNGYFTIYSTAINLNNEFLKYHLADLREKENIISTFLNCDLLVIDDLGTEPMLKNVTEEYLYLIITERLSKKLNTIITTNMSLDQIQDYYGDRIFSRLTSQRDCWLAEIKGKDLRIIKKWD